MNGDRLTVVRGDLGGRQSIAVIGPFSLNDPEVDRLVEQIIEEGSADIVFDLSRTTYVASPGMACMIKAYNKVRAVDGRIYIHGATEDMADLLRLTRLGEYLQFV